MINRREGGGGCTHFGPVSKIHVLVAPNGARDFLQGSPSRLPPLMRASVKVLHLT